MPRGAPKARLVAKVPDSGWVAFVSSNVIGGHYDPATGILWIAFGDSKGGKARGVTYYAYTGVPPVTWEGLLSAGSKGQFHHKNIRNSFGFIGPISS